MAATGFAICGFDDKDSPWPIARKLLAECEELGVLNSGLNDGWSIAFILREGDWAKGGRMTLGTCGVPGVTGAYRDLFDWLLADRLGYTPTFIIMLNAEWWETAGDRRREILLFHEMLHAYQAQDAFGEFRFHRETGEPIPTLRGHDLEEFNDVVRRYGAWKSDVAEFIQAAASYKGDAPAEAERPRVLVDPTAPPEPAVF